MSVPDAIALLEDGPAYAVPERMVDVAGTLAGAPVALYLVDVSGTDLVQVAGGAGFPARMGVEDLLDERATGPALSGRHVAEVIEQLAARRPGWTLEPLWLEAAARGILVVDGPSTPALRAFVRQATAALGLADAYTDRFLRARRAQSTSAAAETQLDLLPPRNSRFPDAELACGLLPAETLGGDWFDHAANPEGCWFAVADACGHGADSTGPAALTLGAFRAVRRRGGSLEQMGSGMHEALEATESDRFVTAIVCRWDPGRAEVSWRRFGHPPPLLLSPEGEARELGPDGGHRPLGVDEPAFDAPAPTVVLSPGDRFVLLTDGVLERSASDGRFGHEGVLAALRTAHSPSASSAVSAVLTAVEHAASAPLADDSTVLVLRALER